MSDEQKTNGPQPEDDELSGWSSHLVEGEDYYIEDGKMVFTEAYLRRRGTCCHSGCRHCPYGEASTQKAR